MWAYKLKDDLERLDKRLKKIKIKYVKNEQNKNVKISKVNVVK